MKTRIAVSGLAIAAIALLGACGSSSSSSEASPSPSASGSTQIVAPVIVAEGQTAATAAVGNYVVYDVADPANVTVSTSNAQVLEVQQGYNDGSANFNPGGKALAPGQADITLVYPDGTSRVVAVTITG